MTTIELIGAHAARPTQFLGTWAHGGWRMKTYGVAYDRAAVRPELVAQAQRIATEMLPMPAQDGSRYGVGFIVVHDGRGGNWILLDWWANDNELNQLLYQSSDDEPTDFRRVTSALIACVHEMKVIVHEYHAWLDTVLENAAGPDLEAYLEATQL